jgi:hypothetical protein
MTKFFQNETAAYNGDKNGLRNVNFKKRSLENTSAAEAGSLLEIIPLHIKNPPVIQFIAYISQLSDNFRLRTDSRQPYGRTEPYYIWQGNDRSIRMTLGIPNSSEAVALDNLNNMSWLAASVYPTYKERMSANSVAASPIYRIRYANLVASVAGGGQGILCVLDGINYSFAVGDGYISIDATGEHAALIKSAGFDQVNRSGDKLLIPKTITLGLNLSIIHDHAVGWDYETGNWRGGQAAPGFPYGFGLARDTKDLPSQGSESSTNSDAAGPGETSAVPGSPQAQQDANTADAFFETNKEDLAGQMGMSASELEKLRES